MSSPCTSNPEEVVGKVVAAKADADKFSKFVNGTAQETVQLGGGDPTPVIRNVVAGLKSTAQQLVQFVADLPEGDISANSATALGSTQSRLLASRFADVVNVKDFGAKGDGYTDDTAAFQAAAATGKAVFVPEGNYIVSDFIDGAFFGTSGSVTSTPIGLCDITKKQSRIEKLVFGGSLAFMQPRDKENNINSWGRAIQGACYDRFDDILYCSAAYAHQGEFMYAFSFSTKNLLGTNYDETLTNRGAFYDAFAHQGLALYRPTVNDEPLFFTSGPSYTAPDTVDATNTNKLRLVRWDYASPHSFEIVKEWTMFDTSVYSGGTRNVCVSEDGSLVCSGARRDSDGVIVVGVWRIADILSATGDIHSLALRIIESPWGTSKINGQAMACDADNIYMLTSAVGENAPHFIKGFSINTGVKTLDRAPTFEGYESDGSISEEGEVLVFLPAGVETHLFLATTSTFSDTTTLNRFYDLENPATFTQREEDAIKIFASETQTTADFVDMNYGLAYASGGNSTDLSNGAWFFRAFGNTDRWLQRQIAYRGNTAADVRTRIIQGDTVSDWYKYLFDNAVGPYGTDYGWPGYNENNSILFRGMSRRDTKDKSCGFISRYRQNTDQGDSSSNVVGVGALENEKWVTALFITTSYTVDSSSVGVVFYLDPAINVSETGKTVTVAKNIGRSNNAWDNAYISSGQISTSDARLKDNVGAPSDALMRAWGKVSFKVFQMKDALQSKGAGARIHVGVIAQEVQGAFASEGLDAGRYGLFCHDRWEDRYDDVEVVDAEAVVDEKGNVVSPAQTHTERRLVEKAGDRFSIRYEEALALECAYQRWLGEQRDARIAELEAKLAGSEA